MDAMEAILGRRSIRKYTDQSVAEATLRELLAAAMAAPSAGNEQPWHFVVIDDRTILEAITRVHPYAAALKEAPVAIVVCGDTGVEKHEGFWVQDCSAATQNFLVAAHAKGLGTVWLGVHPDRERVGAIRKLVGLPASIVPLSIIALGHPAEHKEPAGRFDPTRIHVNRWQKK